MDWNKQAAIHRQLLSMSSQNFTEKMFAYTKKTPYIVGEHHKLIFNALDDVIKGKTKKLIINIGPRYGKTEICSINFIAYGFAINPESNFLHLSYSGGLTKENSLAVKDILESEYYKTVFPKTRIQFGRNTKARWNTTAGGAMYATSTQGQITGFGAGRVDKEEDEDDSEAIIDEFMLRFNPNGFSGAIVIDDPIKPEEALSDNVREQINRRFETTIRNRVNSRNTPIVIIMQRLHEHDLCGYLLETEPDEWTVLSLPAITRDENGRDKALWPFKHTLEELRKLEEINSFVFQTQYMQNPTPLEGLMYRPFKTYDIIPRRYQPLKYCYCDSADTGSDWLCAICVTAFKEGYYVEDVLYSKKPTEYTEQALAQMLTKNNIKQCDVESNNGGRIFMRNVEKLVREYGNTQCSFVGFHQGANKQVRIFTRANEVNNMIYFPSDWERRWPEFARDLKSYRKEGRNAHDDAPDCLSGIIERCGTLLNVVPVEQIKRDFL